jgi:hypothetical protein
MQRGLKYMFMSHHQTSGKEIIRVANKSLKNVTELKYLGVTLKN